MFPIDFWRLCLFVYTSPSPDQSTLFLFFILKCTKLDKILSSHASIIKKQLAAGAVVDDDLVDELLGDVTSVQGTMSLSGSVSSSDVYEPFDQPVSGTDSSPSTPDLQLSAIMEMGFGRESMKDRNNDKDGMGYGLSSSFWRPDPDKLSLAGLLNCLDGVVDSPSRIVIMVSRLCGLVLILPPRPCKDHSSHIFVFLSQTTNHPEKLDPALIRPGRVDKKLLLGFMASPDIVAMLEHFFQDELNVEQKERLAKAVTDGAKLTPAQVEQLAAGHSDVDAMVKTVEAKSRPKLQFKI
jgi:SpoVK/Ycf46/Vps4 family AAA+-type ATPase